jgi:HK97 family phage major capsid protein
MTVEEILAALQAIIDAAKNPDGTERPLTDEEAQRYEQLEGQLKTAQKDNEIRQRNAAYNTTVPGAALAAAVHVGTAKEDDTLERAFNHYLRTGQQNQDIVELRAQSVGTDSAGGYTVPDSMRDKIVDRMKAFGGLASAVEEIPTTSGEPLRWPTLDDTANSGVIAAEGTAPASGGADLVFGEKVLGAFRYVAPGAGQLPLRVSVELLQDSAFDIQGLVERKLGQRIARAQAAHWVTGNGTTEPFGIDTGTSGTAFTSAGITYAELLAAVHEVDPDYREAAKWSFNDATLAKIEGILDSTGRPILKDSTAGIEGKPSGQTLLGYPVVIDQAFPTYTDGGTNKWGVFGDLNQGYVIRRVKDLTLIVNPYSRANEGQVEYVLWARADGVVQDANAFKVLINAV